MKLDSDDETIIECPNCGSNNCVKDIVAKEEGLDTSPIENAFEFIEDLEKSD